MNTRYSLSAILLLVFVFSYGCDLAPDESRATSTPQTTATGAQESSQTEELVANEPLVPFQPQDNNTNEVPLQVQATPFCPQPINICSFNVQFLGNPKNRDNAALANLVGGFDIVVIQELVAPPIPGAFPMALLTSRIQRRQHSLMPCKSLVSYTYCQKKIQGRETDCMLTAHQPSGGLPFSVKTKYSLHEIYQEAILLKTARTMMISREYLMLFLFEASMAVVILS